MLLYNITFPDNDVCSESKLYLRGGELREDCVFIKSGESVTFDTYFNCFSHIKYKKYTRVTDVTLKLDLQGKGVVSVCLFNGDAPKIIAQKEFVGETDIAFNITDLEDKGFIFFTVAAEEDCLLRSGGWYSDLQSDCVKIGVVICTYKREQFVKRNISSLSVYMHSIQDRFFDVYVVDNGQTLTDGFGDGIKIIPNENTGGSGGFTRGMQEVCEACKGEYTHFLLMDDDIVFDASLLWRTYAMLGVLKDEYKNASIGGAMLVLDRPYLQLEMGADWDGIKILSHRKRVDVRNANEIMLNEEDTEVDYNGWFYMCMPVSAIKKFGYPLQLFIKCDDIEYGLRATENIITSSGIAVWHEDFEVKYVPGIEYYINRNELILNSCFPNGKGAFANWKKLVSRVMHKLVLQRYYALDLVFEGYKDFFKGPQYVYSLNGAENHFNIRKNCPKFLMESEIKDEYGISIDYNRINEGMRKRRGLNFKHICTLNGYLIPKCFYKKEIAQVNMIDYNLDGFYKKRKVLQFNPVTEKGFVTEIKKMPLLKSVFKLIGYFFKMAFCYRSAAKKYRTLEIR